MKHSIILLAILIVFVTPLELWSQSNSDIKDQLSSHFKELRMEGDSLSSISSNELVKESWHSLELLTQYEHSENVYDRSEAVKLIHVIGLNSKDARVRKEVVLRLVSACSEKEDIVWQSSAEALLSYTENDFSIDSKKILHTLLQDKPKEQIILLIGVSGMREELGRLRVLTRKNSWAAQLACARLGEIEDIKKAIARVDRHENSIAKIGRYLKELAYTKHPLAYAYIAKFLNSHDRMPPVKTLDTGIAYNQYALDVLASNVVSFPVSRKYIGGYTESDLVVARKWAETDLLQLQNP